MAFRLKIEGNDLVVFEDGTPETEYISNPKAVTVAKFPTTTEVEFYDYSQKQNQGLDPFLLGDADTRFTITALVDDITGLPFTSVAAFKTFIRSRIGFILSSGSGVQTVTGDRVNNTDPLNPIILDDVDNRIVVNQSNVATTLGGTIDSAKQYFIDGSIDMSGVTVTVPSTGIFIKGYNLDLSFLTCADNSYVMFDGATAGNVFFQDISLEVTGTASQVFDLTNGSGFSAVELVRVNFNNCTAIGELNGYRQGLETNTGRFGGTPELTLSGTWIGGYFIDVSIVRGLTNGGYALYKAGTGFSMRSRFRTNQNIDLPASASFFDFAPSNFVNPSTVQVQGALVSRSGVFDATDTNITPNITQADLESAWSNNIGMPNTFEGGKLTLTTEITTSLSVGVWSTIAGTWTTSNLEHFDSPSNGELRHLGTSPREYKCIVNFIVDGGQRDDIGIRVRKWDNSASAFVDGTEIRREVNSFVGGRDVAFYNISFNIELDQNDYVFFQVRNNTDSTNITLELDSDFVIEER